MPLPLATSIGSYSELKSCIELALKKEINKPVAH